MVVVVPQDYQSTLVTNVEVLPGARFVTGHQDTLPAGLTASIDGWIMQYYFRIIPLIDSWLFGGLVVETKIILLNISTNWIYK